MQIAFCCHINSNLGSDAQFVALQDSNQMDGLVQERCNFSALAMK